MFTKNQGNIYTEECRLTDNLRNFLLHYSFPMIIWLSKNGKIEKILFQKKEFNEYKSWDKEAKRYIDKSESIDLVYAIKEYYKAFCNYYRWYKIETLKLIDSNFQN